MTEARDWPGISVIVPTYRDASAAVQTIEAVLPHLRAGDEVLVVDNASEPAHQEVCRELVRRHSGQPVHLLVCRQPGSYAARNMGAQQAQAEILAFTDAGCLPSPQWLSAIRTHFATQRHERLTGPIEMVYRGRTPTLPELMDARMHLNQDGYASQGWAATANAAVRRESFLALGGFAAELVSGGDYEFGIRAMAHGYALGWSPAMVVQHAARETLADLLVKRRRVRKGHTAIAARPGFGDLRHRAMQAMQARDAFPEAGQPRLYPPMPAWRWQLGRLAVRLLREYEQRFKVRM